MRFRPKALIIEDERAIRRLVRVALENAGYRMFEAEAGETGLRMAAERRMDVILLDLGLPDMSGMAWLRTFREWSQTPVLVLTARGGTDDKVAALDGGANDYLTKPFDIAELLARLRVLQRSVPGTPEGPLLIEGDLKVNLATHKATLNGRRLKLTATEEALFYLLVRHVGKVVTCEHLSHSIWGTDLKKMHDLQVLVARLRKKLGPEENSALIRTEGCIGYKLLTATNCDLAHAAPTHRFKSNPAS